VYFIGASFSRSGHHDLETYPVFSTARRKSLIGPSAAKKHKQGTLELLIDPFGSRSRNCDVA
jgi:hypothetical protein